MIDLFLIKSLIVSLWLGVIFSILGIFVFIKRMSFFSDGIAHASILGLALAFLLNFNILFFALLTAVIFSSFIYLLERKTKIHTDTLIGILFVSALSLGIILMSQKSNYQPELLNFLIGNILTITDFDFYFIITYSIFLLILLTFLFKKFLLVSLDRNEAILKKINVNFYEILFYLLLGITVILGIKLAGVILVTAFLVLPPAISSLIATSFRNFIFFNIFFGVSAVIFGFLISYFYNFPLGPSIVLVGSILFLIFFLIKSLLRKE